MYMSRKLSKSKKRPARRSPKKSFLEKLFTFPKLALFGFIVLSVFTVYQVTKPAIDVMGVSVDNDQGYTKEEALAIAIKQKAEGVPIDKYTAVYLWKDANSNAEIDNEGCLQKQFTIKKNGITKTPTQKNCDSKARLFKTTANCNTFEFVKVNTINKYKLTGLQVYETGRQYGKALPGVKKETVCGFPLTVGDDRGGYVYNEIDFGVKAN